LPFDEWIFSSDEPASLKISKGW